MFKVVSMLACPISCAITLPGTPLSCDHDEYVRRNVSQVVLGSPSVLHAGKMDRRNTLLGESGVPLCVENTSASGSAFCLRAFHSSTSSRAAVESGIWRDPASVF